MRCLSRHTDYSIQVFEGKDQVVTDPRGYATLRALEKPVIADFEHAGVLDHEAEAVLSAFTFSGLPEGVHPLSRVGVFDTELYSLRFPERDRDAMQVQIEQRLRELQKQHAGSFIIVDTPVAQKPWGKYDDLSVEDILKYQEALGADPTQIRRYEAENANRPEIIKAMTALEAEAAKEVEGAIVVEA